MIIFLGIPRHLVSKGTVRATNDSILCVFILYSQYRVISFLVFHLRKSSSEANTDWCLQGLQHHGEMCLAPDTYTTHINNRLSLSASASLSSSNDISQCLDSKEMSRGPEVALIARIHPLSRSLHWRDQISFKVPHTHTGYACQ